MVNVVKRISSILIELLNLFFFLNTLRKKITNSGIEKKIKMLVNEISLGKNTTKYLRCTVWILSFF